ncbi:MAG: ribulose-phosphate 3-epimerase [Verrucomicrobiales bacterium]|nr:ribulose-phosphate 3-epimerase [Verrucomicrobiales bacterium]
MHPESHTPPSEIIILPSVLAADWSCMGDEVRRAEAAGARRLHLDVMDGAFVDNISFGPNMVKTIRGVTDLYLDTHLMIHRADHYLQRFIDAGTHNITVHVEAHYDTSLAETLGRIRAAGLQCGLALNPATPLDAALPYLHQIDLLLVMTVVPGFGGQSFMEKETMPKLAAARDYRDTHGLHFHLQVDGGIYPDTAGIAARHGANLLVCGTSSFGPPDMTAALHELATAARSPA